MKPFLIALTFILGACTAQHGPYQASSGNEFAKTSIIDYSKLGSRNFNSTPFVYIKADISTRKNVCLFLTENNIKLIRAKHVILSSQKLREEENRIVNSEKFQYLFNQKQSGDENQAEQATYLINQMEKAIKAEVEATLLAAMQELTPRFQSSGATAILFGDYYDAIHPECPDVFSFEPDLINKIDKK